ncbi:MAG: class I SAM-dependent methyltransferase [Proteobacteria bacterium]|nr:class I SAM-dependent methyltransferase [Pseudomonadota bacterium]
MASSSTEAALHAAYASRGGSQAVFAPKVADYVASRPDYPQALFDRLTELGALSPNARIADIGAGTGLLTAGLLARGHEVVAVEPNDAMRAAADALLHDRPGYRSVAGSAETTNLPPASVDLVTAAQAFHWFVVDRTRAEFLRVLATNGQVALIWNDRLPDDPLQRAIAVLFRRHGGSERAALTAHEERLGVQDFYGRGRIEQIDVPHEQRLGRAGFAALLFSRSYMPPRASAAGTTAEHDVDALFDAHAEDGAVVVRYRTIAYVGRPVI